MRDYSHAYGLKACSLRYFNAAGGDPEYEIKDYQSNHFHLIPVTLHHLKNDRPITIFGDNHSTPDGTCIRDYIHVNDIANAHIMALERLFIGDPQSICYNLGNGNGYSVREVIEQAQKVTGLEAKVSIGQPRDCDPPYLLANATKAQEELGWKPQYPNLKSIIEHAWKAMS